MNNHVVQSSNQDAQRFSRYCFILLSLAIVARALASIFIKQAADSSFQGFSVVTVVNPWYISAIICLVIQAISWVLVLRYMLLSRAYPYLSLVFVINLFAARFLFHESIGTLHIVGILCIIGGIVVSNMHRVSVE